MLPHLQIVALLWLALASLRLAVWRWLPGELVPQIGAAVMLEDALVLLVTYYLLVVVGLLSWGRVVS